MRHGCGAVYRLAAPQPKIGAAVLPVLTIFGLSATAPQRASTIFESLRTCMDKHNRAITVVLCLAFGAFSRGRSMGVEHGNRGSAAI